MHQRTVVIFALCFACGPMDDAPGLDAENTNEQAIKNGENAWTFEAQRAVWLDNCSGVLISPRHVLTAAHCGTTGRDWTLHFYAGNTTIRSRLWRRANLVAVPPCVTADRANDCSGKFADLIILELAEPLDPSWNVRVASLEWRYSGSGQDILKVGSGDHDGVLNAGRVLKWQMDTTWSGSDGSGYFWSSNADLNPGDSGGPAYFDDRVMGIAFSDGWNWEAWRNQNRYTSVPSHLDWILNAINYNASAPFWLSANRRIPFTATNHINTFTGLSAQRCKYACDKTSGCLMYSFASTAPTSCDLYSAATYSNVATSGAQVGYRYY